jgi:RNA polymerase sigma factor (sigma-70 family)
MSPLPSSLPPEELLAEVSFLRALARGLLRDEHAGEDVAQTTWVEALDRREAPGNPLVNPRAWLARVARNLALDRRRGERRRAARERGVARDEALPSVADTLAHESTLRAVTDAVLELDEPYRATILWHYFEGLDLREIAERSREPLATVRSRHARALARLRERLDRSHGGERRAWAVALASLLGNNVPPLERGDDTRDSTEVDGPANAPLLASKWSLATGLGLVCLSVLWSWVALSARGADGSLPAPIGSATPALETTTATLDGSFDGSLDGPSARTSRESVARPLLASSNVRVLWSDGQPAAGVSVFVVPPGSLRSDLEQTLHVTDATGEFRLAGLAPGAPRMYVDRVGFVESRTDETASGETANIELVIPAGIDVHGQVVDLLGAPVAEAEIWISSPVNTSVGLCVARSDARGNYRVRSLSTGHAVGARKAGQGPSPEFFPNGRPGGDAEQLLVLQAAGAAVHVRVRDPQGRPIPGARVLLSHEGDGSFAHAGYPQALLAEGWVQRPSRALLFVDASGACDASGLEPGKTRVIVAASGWAPHSEVLELESGAARELAVLLESGVTIRGNVHGPDHAPLGGAQIEVSGAGGLGACWTESASDGRYRLEHVPAGEIEITAGVERAGRTSARLRGKNGAELEWNPVLDPGRVLQARLVDMLDERGAGLAGLEIVAAVGPRDPRGVRSFQRRCTTDAAGEFRVLDCPAEPLRIEVRLPENAAPFPVAEFEGLRADAPPLELRLPEGWRPDAEILGSVTGIDGVPCAAEIELAPAGDRGASVPLYADESGRFRTGLLRAGDYGLTVRGQFGGSRRLERVSLGAAQRLDLGVLQLGGAGTVSAELKIEAGIDPDRLEVFVARARGDELSRLRKLSAEELRAGIELPAGDYELWVTGAAELRLPFTLDADQVTHLSLRPRRVVGVAVVGEGAESLEPSASVEFLFHARDARDDWRTTIALPRAPDAGSVLLSVFVPTSDGYTVEVRAPGGLRGTASVEAAHLAPGASASPPIAVELR